MFNRHAPAIAALLVIGLAIFIRCVAPIDPNIDWLMSNDRAFLAGHRLYVDIVETNPPMAIFIYLPAAWIESWTGLSAEAVFTAMVLLVGAASAWIFCRCARSAGVTTPWLLPLVLFALLVAPLSAFGEREHVALILIMPVLGVAMMRAARLLVPLTLMIGAGLAAGIVPMIKPHFALGIAAVYLALAIRRRDARLLICPEVLIAAAMVVAYAGLVWAFIPAYGHSVVPMLLDLYRPLRSPVTDPAIAGKLAWWAGGVACLIWSMRREVLQPVPFVLLAASAGFVLGFIDQGRGWAYHALPFAMLTLIAVLVAVAPALAGSDSTRRIAAVAAVLAALVPLGTLTGFTGRYDKVVAPIRATVAHPTVMSIAFDLTPGHPIATEVGGTWAGTFSSRWISVNANHLLQTERDPARQARLKAWMRYDRAVTNQDLMKRPDIVLVGLGPFDWPGWIAADPQTRALMGDYVPLAEDPLTPQQRLQVEGVTAYVRKDLLRQAR
jgi:hypothetical protein